LTFEPEQRLSTTIMADVEVDHERKINVEISQGRQKIFSG
jgi:hypothetical protein